MLSKLTLVGMHNYSDGAIWENLKLPEGYNEEIIIAEILRQGGEFSVLYPDLDYMKYMIGIWSKKFYHNFERWYNAFCFEYEALYNLDVKSTITTATKDKDEDLKHFGMLRKNQTMGLGRNDKAAYDADTFKPTAQDSTSYSTSESESHSESNSHSYEHSETIEEYRRGNQGITMSQEMLLAEYNAWRSNIYEMIAELFVSEFCICIYQ